MNRWTKCDSCLPRVHLIFFKAWPRATLCLPPKYIPCSLTGANMWQFLAMRPMWKCVGDFWKVLFPPHLYNRLSSSWLPFSYFFPVFDAFYSTWKSKPVTTFMWKKKKRSSRVTLGSGAMAKLSLHCGSPRNPDWELQDEDRRPEGGRL